ncbi:MAG TPA: hypothetical protein VGN37_27795 [Actinocatenispora sp.]
MGSDPTVNVVVFRLGSVDGPVPVDTDARADDAVRKAWWKVILKHRPRAQDVLSVHSDWQPSPDDASFIARTFVNAAVSHEFDRPAPDGWQAAFDLASRTLADRTVEPDPPAAPEPATPPASGTRTPLMSGRPQLSTPTMSTRPQVSTPAMSTRPQVSTPTMSTRPGPPPRRPDPDWPFLSAEQGARIREQTRAAVARLGVATTVRGPILFVDGTDWEFPLDNLARNCHQAPESAWPGIIETHAATAASIGRGDREDESAGRPVLRLLADDTVEWEIRYARHVADGLIELIGLDLPDRVRLLNDDDVAGTDLTRMRATARANLIAEPVQYQRIEQDDAVLHRVYGDSMFVASKALVLPELMRAEMGTEPPRDGVLVAVPSRHEMVLHPLLDASAVPALNNMVMYARGEFDESPGPLSPYVHWWHDGELVPVVAEFDDTEQEIRVVIPPGLGDVLNRICG